MKPLFIFLSILSSFFATHSKAADDVNAAAVKSFQQTFTEAKEVSWTNENDFYKVSFLLNDQFTTALYSCDGKLVSVTRNISSLQLPIMLQSEFKKNYAAYWISDLFEMASSRGTEYYMTVENADAKIILKSAGTSEWVTYQKTLK